MRLLRRLTLITLLLVGGIVVVWQLYVSRQVSLVRMQAVSSIKSMLAGDSLSDGCSIYSDEAADMIEPILRSVSAENLTLLDAGPPLGEWDNWSFSLGIHEGVQWELIFDKTEGGSCSLYVVRWDVIKQGYPGTRVFPRGQAMYSPGDTTTSGRGLGTRGRQ